eukprot:7990738-Ditylum_brightwellii.AAC.1
MKIMRLTTNMMRLILVTEFLCQRISQFVHHCQWRIGQAASGRLFGDEGRLSILVLEATAQDSTAQHSTA